MRREKEAMHKRNIPVLVSRRWVVFATVVALAGLSASLMNAASVFIWVANGSSVTGYSTSGAAVSGASLTCSSGDCFSLATSGTSGTDENLFVANSGTHTLAEYSWNGTDLTSTGPSFTFAPDPAGGNISPQEIAVGGAGNLWTTSIDGKIVVYDGTTGDATTVEPAGGSLVGARGIMIDGSTVYVTVEGTYGSGSVYSFPTSGGAPTLYASVSGTVGGQVEGQMRGISYDSQGDIFYADSTWGPSGSDQGYINESTGGAVISGLNGPNELEIGNGSNGSGCDYLYVAGYYAGTVNEYSNGEGAGCGTVGTLEVSFLSGLGNPSGIALSPGNGGLGGDSVGVGPTFISGVSATPEPGTFALMTGALLLALGIGIRTQRRRLQ
jgi:hypothetical protein